MKFGWQIICLLLGVVASLCICVVMILAIETSVAQADTLPTLTLTVTNIDSAVPAAQITAAEQAVTTEVNTDFRQYWNVPQIQFVPSGGTPILLYAGKGIWGAAAAHEVSAPFNDPTSPIIPW